MKWDKKGAVDSLGTKKCSVCEKIKPVHVVVTVHGHKDLHFPCCSNECMEVVAVVAAEERKRQKNR